MSAHCRLVQFTFGFSQLPTPSQMRASLADQLEVEDLRKHFRKYAAGRAAPELPDFYKVKKKEKYLLIKKLFRLNFGRKKMHVFSLSSSYFNDHWRD